MHFIIVYTGRLLSLAVLCSKNVLAESDDECREASGTSGRERLQLLSEAKHPKE